MTALEKFRSSGPGKPGRTPRFPLRHFEVGEEMFFAGVDTETVRKYACGCKPMRFKIRQVQMNGVPGAFVWRTA